MHPSPPYHPQVYQPEADTYLLAQTALREILPGEKILEIGCGSGVVAAYAAQIPKTMVYATDINPYACESASSLNLEVIRTDMAAGICGEFDLVLCNPPYLPTAEGERLDDWLEYALDGGEDGREFIRRFAVVVGRLLTPTGRALILLSSLTGVSEAREIFDTECLLSMVVAQEQVEDETLYVLRVMRDMCRGCPIF